MCMLKKAIKKLIKKLMEKKLFPILKIFRVCVYVSGLVFCNLKRSINPIGKIFIKNYFKKSC